MSGHSKWHSIKHKKGAADAKKGAIFTRHARLIALAAKNGGGDQEMNPSLRMEIERAKGANMPNLNIERAIKKGTGEDKEGADIVEATYEAYGPGGIALMIHSVTDNKNRALNNIRTIVSKHGGNFGAGGSVGFLFEKKGVITVELPQEKNADDIELAAIDAGAADTQVSKNEIEIHTEIKDLGKVRDALKAAGVEIKSAELRMVAKDDIAVTDEKTAEKIIKLMNALEDDEDVADVYGNFDISEDILEKMI